MSNTMRFCITDGPSSRTLVDAFFYAHGQGTSRMRAIFTLRFTPSAHDVDVTPEDLKFFKASASIQSIGHEDGSGMSFNIAGYIKMKDSEKLDGKWYSFTGYYHAKNRKGYILATERE